MDSLSIYHRRIFLREMTTESDYTITYLPIAPLALPAIQTNYSKANPKPITPTYTVDAIGGTIAMEHDETTVETDEEKLALQKYKEDLFNWEAGLTNRIMTLIFLEGVELDVKKATQKKWDSRLRRLFDNFDEMDEDDKKILYLQNYVFKTNGDVQKVIQTVMELTGVKEEDREAAEQLF